LRAGFDDATIGVPTHSNLSRKIVSDDSVKVDLEEAFFRRQLNFGVWRQRLPSSSMLQSSFFSLSWLEKEHPEQPLHEKLYS
jgi:hypothetical protein